VGFWPPLYNPGMKRFLALLAIPAVLLGLPTAALAATAPVNTGQHLKETSGPGYYAGTGSLGYNATVSEEFGGRLMAFTPTGGTLCDAAGDCYPKGVLVFTSGTNTCAAAPNSPNIVQVEACSGGNGVTWAEKVTNGHDRFINIFWTNQDGIFQYLAGAGGGTAKAMFTANAAPGNGYLEAFDFL
jgi:hypothetical protein